MDYAKARNKNYNWSTHEWQEVKTPKTSSATSQSHLHGAVSETGWPNAKPAPSYGMQVSKIVFQLTV